MYTVEDWNYQTISSPSRKIEIHKYQIPWVKEVQWDLEKRGIREENIRRKHVTKKKDCGRQGSIL